MADELRKGFHRDLETIRRDLVRLAALTTEMVTRATDALLDGDPVTAQMIIDGDDVLDVRSLEIEHACFRLLALQAPMAADLRVLAATMRINGYLERAADLAVNIAKGAMRIHGAEIPARLRGIIALMSDEAVRLLRVATDAYLDGDGALGAAIEDMDNHLDQLQRDFIEAMFALHETAAMAVQPAVQLALISRYYERIGDHAVSIGERVAFIDTGLPAEPPAAERIRRRRAAHPA